jgi:serine/threonine-protein kinase
MGSGERVGRYVLLKPMGRGGMAEVFLARRDGSSELCVLKKIRDEKSTEHLARARREANILSQLHHPAIARLVDAGVDGDRFFIVLELIRGRTLRAILDRLIGLAGPPMPAAVAIRVAVSVLEGLAYAHALRDAEGRPLDLVHRDLSPSNIMLTEDGRARIIDFGIASGKLDDFRTSPGVVLGTMRYLSPEQALSKPIDRRSDLYTLGVVLYEMLAGVPVVERQKRDDILERVVRKEPEPFTLLAPHLHPGLWPVVSKALAKDPKQRYAEAAEFRSALVASGASIAGDSDVASFLRACFPQTDAPPTSTDAVEETARDPTSSSSSTNPQPPEVPFTRVVPSELTSAGQVSAMVVEIPTLADRPSPTSAELRPKRLFATVALTLFAGAMVVAGVRASDRREPSPEPPPIAHPITTFAHPIPMVRPHGSPDAGAQATEHSIPTEVPKAPRGAPKAVLPIPPPSPLEPSRSSELREALEALEQAPRSVALMEALHSRIVAASSRLPDDVRRRVRARADAARRVIDVDGFTRVVEEIERMSQDGRSPSAGGE